MTEALGHVTPAAVATYLVRTGWTRMGGRNAGSVWTQPLDGGVRHLFQPEVPTSPDYALRMGEMLAALAVAEGRSQLGVIIDLHGPAADHDTSTQPAEGTARRTD